MNQEMKFKDVRDLAKLKYFEVGDKDRLVLRKEEAERAIDFHAHLGMSFLFGKRLNLFLKTPRVDYFFPERGMQIDLDIYSALCIPPERGKKIAFEFVRTAVDTSGFVSTQTVPNILEDMDRMRISHSVILALDYPWGLSKISENFMRYLKHEPRLICYPCVHPYATRPAEKAAKFIQEGAAGFKMHPQQLMYRANNPRLRKILEVCQAKRVPVLFHSGHSPVAPKWQSDWPLIKYFAEPVRDFPNLIFIFGHSGIEEYDKVIELGKKHDNVYMETSGQPPRRIREMVNGIGVERVLYGSDWPFYSFEMPMAKALIATEGNTEWREQILYKNAARLLKEYGGVEV